MKHKDRYIDRVNAALLLDAAVETVPVVHFVETGHKVTTCCHKRVADIPRKDLFTIFVHESTCRDGIRVE